MRRIAALLLLPVIASAQDAKKLADMLPVLSNAKGSPPFVAEGFVTDMTVTLDHARIYGVGRGLAFKLVVAGPKDASLIVWRPDDGFPFYVATGTTTLFYDGVARAFRVLKGRGPDFTGSAAGFEERVGHLRMSWHGHSKEPAVSLDLRSLATRSETLASEPLEGGVHRLTGVTSKKDLWVAWIRPGTPMPCTRLVLCEHGDDTSRLEIAIRRGVEAADRPKIPDVATLKKILPVLQDVPEAELWERIEHSWVALNLVNDPPHRENAGEWLRNPDWPAMERDYAKAREELGKLLGAGPLTAAYPSGWNELRAGNLAAARAHLEEAERAGDSRAWVELGKIHLRGADGAKDVPRATSCLEKAAEIEYGEAQRLLGQLLVSGGDHERGLAWYRRAAARGDGEAARALGIAYTKGEGVAADEALALRWFHVAAERQDPVSMYVLAVSYLKGRGVPEDQEKGLELLFGAIAGELPAAHLLFATLLETGEAGPKDEVRAEHHYKRAAELGSAEGQLAYALFCLKKGGRHRDRMAAEWLAKAVDQRLETAAFELARLYEEGRGVPKDTVKAHALFTIAKSPEAERLAKGMTPKELEDSAKIVESGPGGGDGEPR